MSIRIPSTNIYKKENKKILDNQINNIYFSENKIILRNEKLYDENYVFFLNKDGQVTNIIEDNYSKSQNSNYDSYYIINKTENEDDKIYAARVKFSLPISIGVKDIDIESKIRLAITYDVFHQFPDLSTAETKKTFLFRQENGTLGILRGADNISPIDVAATNKAYIYIEKDDGVTIEGLVIFYIASFFEVKQGGVTTSSWWFDRTKSANVSITLSDYIKTEQIDKKILDNSNKNIFELPFNNLYQETNISLKNEIIISKVDNGTSGAVWVRTDYALNIGDVIYYNGSLATVIKIDTGNGYSIMPYLSANSFVSMPYGETVTVNIVEYWTNELSKKILNSYKNGKETAKISCSISDYYDYDSGEKVISIDNSIGKMSFRLYDQVIPMVYGADGKDRPMSLNKNGKPKVFQVLGSKIYYNGAVWQELSLQEI